MAWEGDMRRLILAAAAALTLAVPANALGVGTVHDHRLERDGFDARAGAVAPSAAQRAIVEAMGANFRVDPLPSPLVTA